MNTNLFSLFSKKQSSSIFVPFNDGFKEMTDPLLRKSINEITIHLGYHPDQTDTCLGDFGKENGIQGVIMEVFSKNVIFVLTKDHVVNLEKKVVDKFLSNYHVKNVFDGSKTKSILDEGIANKSLSIGFLSRVLNLKDTEPNGVFYTDKLELYLYFNEGYLTDYDSSDGLNEWAKIWKANNPTMLSDYETIAKKYWGNNSSKILNEINLQAQTWANVPHANKNEFVQYHTTELNTVNYLMLLVRHYNYQINFTQFKDVNFGRYKEITEHAENATKRYLFDNYIYEFDTSGEIIGFFPI